MSTRQSNHGSVRTPAMLGALAVAAGVLSVACTPREPDRAPAAPAVATTAAQVTATTAAPVTGASLATSAPVAGDVDRPACVPLVVRTAAGDTPVRLGIGVAC